MCLEISGPRRCQRSSVPGVTSRQARSPLSMTMVSAARKVRPVQDGRGRGFVRRSTATWWRSASISMFLADEDRASKVSQPNTVTISRYVRATNTGVAGRLGGAQYRQKVSWSGREISRRMSRYWPSMAVDGHRPVAVGAFGPVPAGPALEHHLLDGPVSADHRAGWQLDRRRASGSPGHRGQAVHRFHGRPPEAVPPARLLT
jgi:hypothetical protein